MRGGALFTVKSVYVGMWPVTALLNAPHTRLPPAPPALGALGCAC